MFSTTLYCLLFGFVYVVESATVKPSIQKQLESGLCLCIEEDDVFARTAPAGSNPIVGVLKKDHCLVSNGGISHDGNDVTWYEVKTVDGQIMWIDGKNLRAVHMTVCTNPTTTSQPTTKQTVPVPITTAAPKTTTTPFDPFAGLDFCFTDSGLVGEGQQGTQNGVVCTCHASQLVCP